MANAQNLSVQTRPARADVKVATVASASSGSGSLGGVKFSDPYAPPVGTGKTAIARFPAMPTDEPVQPQGGVSFRAESRFPRRAHDRRAEAEILIASELSFPHRSKRNGPVAKAETASGRPLGSPLGPGKIGSPARLQATQLCNQRFGLGLCLNTASKVGKLNIAQELRLVPLLP